MTKHNSPYSSYLLRIWSVAEGEMPEGRAWLQDLTTGERAVFVNLESLFAFLESALPAAKEATDQADMKTKLDD